LQQTNYRKISSLSTCSKHFFQLVVRIGRTDAKKVITNYDRVLSRAEHQLKRKKNDIDSHLKMYIRMPKNQSIHIKKSGRIRKHGFGVMERAYLCRNKKTDDTEPNRANVVRSAASSASSVRQLSTTPALIKHTTPALSTQSANRVKMYTSLHV
jgi:hypothetical protein